MNRLGQGISYSVLSELHTENAFQIQDVQLAKDDILPLESQNEEFTIYVADNIEGEKEHYQIIKSPCFSFLLNPL